MPLVFSSDHHRVVHTALFTIYNSGIKMDILFFNPPQTRDGYQLNNYALLWIASYLKRDGFDTRVLYLDEEFEATIKGAMNIYRPRYVAVSCKWYTNLYGAILVAREVRKCNKDIRIITGGNTATCFGKALLQSSDFDIVIRGDAELPLLNLLKGDAPVNCTVKEKGRIVRYRREYIQRREELRDYTLADPVDILQDPEKVLGDKNYVWTGKGCLQNCFYCGGSASAQKDIFGRVGLLSRPIENVLADIALFSRYSRSLQFDSPFPGGNDAYYMRMFRNMPKGRYLCQFHHWHLPSRSFIDRIGEAFELAVIVLDTSTLCEELRGRLCGRHYLKPFFSNKDLEAVIEYCARRSNIQLELYNIAGLPGERARHVREYTDYAKYLTLKYPSIGSIFYIPLSLEPGAALHKRFEKFKMCCCRDGFDDYLNLGRQAFESNAIYPFDQLLLDGDHGNAVPHPYGVYETGRRKNASYLKAKRFREAMEREFKANRLLMRYIQKGSKNG